MADPETHTEPVRLLHLRGADAEINRDYRDAFRDVIAGVVATLSHVAGNPELPGYSRVYGPIDPSLDDDDPLARLERQYEFENALDVARAVNTAASLSTAQCETLLRLFTVYCSVLAETWGIYQESDLDDLRLDRAATLGLAQMLQPPRQSWLAKE